MHFVCNYNSNGPYFSPTQGQYHAARLKDIIFHVRTCMEDADYQIGVFDDDGEGCMVLAKPDYVLYRPGSMSAGMWNLHLRKFKRP